MAELNPVEVIVEEVAAGTTYRLSIQDRGVRMSARQVELRHDDLVDAFENGRVPAAFNLGDVRQYVGNSPVDLYLPDDRVAGLDWEQMSRGRVVRCTSRDYNFRREPIGSRLNLGFVSTVPVQANVFAGLADSIERATHNVLDVKVIDAGDLNRLERVIRELKLHAIHVLVQPELTASGPHVSIGGKHIPLQRVIRAIAKSGTRLVFLQSIRQEPGAIAALRWGGQYLPPTCETSMILCTAAPSQQFLSTIRDCYESVLRDEPLPACMARLGPEYASVTSIVTHAGNRSGLGLSEDLNLTRRRLQGIVADFARLGETIDLATGSDEVRVVGSELAAKSEPLIAELASVAPVTLQAETQLKGKLEEVAQRAEPDPPRYPAAWFYHVDASTKTPIPDTETLTWPPPLGIGLEFHFWLDIVKTGIASITEVPAFHKPKHLPYPLKLQIAVWSDEFEFSALEGELTLLAHGPTEHAIFPVTRLPAPPRQVELFVFVRHAGTLIAAFRVEAGLTRHTELRQGAQTIEHAYVASNYFRFEAAPTASALTIFITKKQGALQLFTMKDTGTPWATLGPTESGLYEKNKEIYREVQTLARRAEVAAAEGQTLSFAKEAKRLAQLGYPLFGDLFLQGDTEDPGVFVDEFVRKLPEDSSVTIAIGREAQNLHIPWGLLYDRKAPQDHFDAPEMQGFLGYKFNLAVRPSLPQSSSAGGRQLPIRMGAAWLEHEETEALRKSFEPYQRQHKLVIEPLRAEDNTLPGLAANEYDLVEFFCHGHTKLEGLFTSDEIEQLLKSYRESSAAGGQNTLLMAIEESSDSLLDLNGGIVTLTSLADSLKKPMPGRPVILLSMCESAQVSASGTGFVPLFLRRGARAVIGTEGPTLWTLSRELDTAVVGELLKGATISHAFHSTRKQLAKSNMMALIYTVYGDPGARLV